VLAVLAACVSLPLAACSTSPASSNGHITLKVAYGSQFVFLTPQLAIKWWGTVAKEFEAAHPNVTVDFTPIPGSYNDIVTKLSLLYRTPSTAPDVAELPAGQLGSWVSSGYLLPVDKYVAKSSWWKSFPAAVQNETRLDGHYYGVNHGENTNALWYNVPMFRRDVLAAAQKIHSTYPSDTAMWAAGGTAAGTIGIQYNGGNLLTGSTNSTIFDSATKKWVADSPGLRQTMQFYKTLGQEHLQAPTSELLNPNSVDNLPATLAKNNVGIAIGANFYGESWVKSTCGPCWAAAPTTMAVTPLPTINGQVSGVASVLGGWELAIGSQTANPDLAWDFINFAQQQNNMIDASNWGGWIPPATTAASAPQYTNYAPPFQAEFAKLMPVSQEEPVTADFTVWGTGFNDAVSAIIQNPNISVSAAIAIMKTYITNQLGPSKVETIP
jgi:multiple sugar transport system substrate-binding protein